MTPVCYTWSSMYICHVSLDNRGTLISDQNHRQKSSHHTPWNDEEVKLFQVYVWHSCVCGVPIAKLEMRVTTGKMKREIFCFWRKFFIPNKILTNLLLKMETFGQFDEPDFQMELDHRSKSTEFEFRDAMDCFWKTLQVCSHRK